MKKSRRRLLKALAAGGGVVAVDKVPQTWSRPVTESVMLAAHAQTTQDTNGGGDPSPSCSAPAGCYAYGQLNRSFTWPGGTGPVVPINSFPNTTCADETDGVAPGLVVASSASEAATIFQANNVNFVTIQEAEDLNPPLQGGCAFFFAVIPPP